MYWYVNKLKLKYVVIIKVQNAGKPIKILIKKQLGSTIVHPTFSQKKYSCNHIHVMTKPAIQNPLKNFHIDADSHLSSCSCHCT